MIDEQTVWILERNSWDRVAQHHKAAALMWFDVRHEMDYDSCRSAFSIHLLYYKDALNMSRVGEWYG